MISAIIPVLNEERLLPRLIHRLREAPGVEVVVADGGSADGTVPAAERAGAVVVRGAAGRGIQMNAGAAAAKGELLFFVHADAMPPIHFDSVLSGILRSPHTSAGAFRLKIDASGVPYRMIERCANRRSRIFSLPYGDQGFFLRRSTFERLGGFAAIPLMEDVELVRRCRRLGAVVTASESMTVSARRWLKDGWIKATIRNSALLILFLSGVSPRRLASYYPPPA